MGTIRFSNIEYDVEVDSVNASNKVNLIRSIKEETIDVENKQLQIEDTDIEKYIFMNFRIVDINTHKKFEMIKSYDNKQERYIYNIVGLRNNHRVTMEIEYKDEKLSILYLVLEDKNKILGMKKYNIDKSNKFNTIKFIINGKEIENKVILRNISINGIKIEDEISENLEINLINNSYNLEDEDLKNLVIEYNILTNNYSINENTYKNIDILLINK